MKILMTKSDWEQMPQERKSKVQRFAFILAWFMRIFSIACFLYGGTLSAKNYGPGMIRSIKEALTKDSMDPVTLFKMEQVKQRALEEEKRRAREAAAKLARGGKEYGASDDPYQYVAGGKKPDIQKANAANKSNEAKKAAVGKDKAGDKAGLWDKAKMGAGDMKQFDIASASGGSGAGALGGLSGLAGAGQEGIAKNPPIGREKGAKNDPSGSGAGTNMNADTGGYSPGSTSRTGRSKRHSISQGKAGKTMAGGSMDRLKKSAYQAVTGVNTAKGAQSGSQIYQTGSATMDGSKTGAALNIPIGTSAEGVIDTGGNIKPTVQNISNQAVDAPGAPEEEESADDYNSYTMVLDTLGLAIGALGIILSLTLGEKDTPNGAFWWVMYAVGWALIATMLILAIALAGQGELAKSIAMGYIGIILSLITGWIGLSASQNMWAVFSAGVIQSVLKLATAKK